MQLPYRWQASTLHPPTAVWVNQYAEYIGKFFWSAVWGSGHACQTAGGYLFSGWSDRQSGQTVREWEACGWIAPALAIKWSIPICLPSGALSAELRGPADISECWLSKSVNLALLISGHQAARWLEANSQTGKDKQSPGSGVQRHTRFVQEKGTALGRRR